MRESGVLKAWMVYTVAASNGASSGILMLLLRCVGMSSFQLRWLAGGTWTGLKSQGTSKKKCSELAGIAWNVIYLQDSEILNYS